MKHPIELKLLFKNETGNTFSAVEDSFDLLKEYDGGSEWNVIIIEEYISWLEDKLMESLKNKPVNYPIVKH